MALQVVSLLPVDDPDGAGGGGLAAGEDGAKYPFRSVGPTSAMILCGPAPFHVSLFGSAPWIWLVPSHSLRTEKKRAMGGRCLALDIE
jgi:hypothetical protein